MPLGRPRATFVCLAFAGVALGVACGSRGPLDIEIVEGVGTSDASSDDADALADAADEADVPHDAPADTRRRDATPIDCVLCLGQQCGTLIFKCVQSPPCQQTFQCAVQKCFAGGNPNPSCLLQCANDPSGIAQVLQVLQCVTSKCGTDCTSLLGALGGGGGGGGGRDAGRKSGAGDETLPSLPQSDAERRAVIRESFAPWPQLCGE